MKLSKKKVKKAKKMISIIIGLILFVLMLINTYLIVKYNVLPVKYLILYTIIIILIPLFIIYATIFRRPKKSFRCFFNVLEIIYIIVLLIAFIYLNQTFNFLDKFTNGYDYETKNYYVIVAKDSKINKIDGLNNKKIGFAKNTDTSIDKAITELEDKIKYELVEKNTYNELFASLENKEIDAILMIDSLYNLLTEDDEILRSNIKILYQFNIKEKIKEIGKDVNVTEEPFNIYISGIDSYGKVTDKGRSDVNILLSVNPKTHKVLMINIPRDYYVKLSGGINQMDKLTHAGIYGVDVSVGTIENLLDIEINYYVKVNYNAVIRLVDALGGVDVYSEYNFSSADYHYKIVKGYNHVDGKMALDFVRTRKAFVEADRVRGENQQRMIEAIMKKANSPKILVKYGDILEALDGTFTTNVSTEKIMSLVNMQLDKMPTWETKSISLNGTDGSGITYSVPGMELYIMNPDEETINEAKEEIDQMMEFGTFKE